MKVDSNASAPTKLFQVSNERYPYRRFGNGTALPLLLPQHFTGTLDYFRPRHFSLPILRSRPIELHNYGPL